MQENLRLTSRFRLLVEGLLICVSIVGGRLAHGQASNPPSGQQIFSSTCAACHGLDGRGGEHAPDIATSTAVQQKSDAELTKIIRQGIPSVGMPGFDSLLGQTQIRSVLNHLRVLQRDDDQSTPMGDAWRGRQVFFGAGRCAECHMFEGRGGFLGNDLSGYGQMHSAGLIRDWILNPDKDHDVRYGMATVVTRQRKTYRGLVRNEDNFSLQMETADGRFLFLDKDGLARIEHEPRSLMPHDYDKKLTTTQLDDVVGFLVQAKAAGSRAKTDESDQDQ